MNFFLLLPLKGYQKQNGNYQLIIQSLFRQLLPIQEECCNNLWGFECVVSGCKCYYSVSCRFTASLTAIKCTLIAPGGQWFWQRHQNIWVASQCNATPTEIRVTDISSSAAPRPMHSDHVFPPFHCMSWISCIAYTTGCLLPLSLSLSVSPLYRLLSFAWHPCQTMPSKKSESVLTGFTATVNSSSRPVSHARDGLYFSRL